MKIRGIRQAIQNVLVRDVSKNGVIVHLPAGDVQQASNTVMDDKSWKNKGVYVPYQVEVELPNTDMVKISRDRGDIYKHVTANNIEITEDWALQTSDADTYMTYNSGVLTFVVDGTPIATMDPVNGIVALVP